MKNNDIGTVSIEQEEVEDEVPEPSVSVDIEEDGDFTLDDVEDEKESEYHASNKTSIGEDEGGSTYDEGESTYEEGDDDDSDGEEEDDEEEGEEKKTIRIATEIKGGPEQGENYVDRG